MGKINLSGMSADELQSLAKRATDLAKELEEKQPTYRVALENGIMDRSYSTVRWGEVSSYSGEVEITMGDGSRWRAVGHGPTGTAEEVYRHGWIEFIPLLGDSTSLEPIR